jgi:hypothetical protein
MATTPTEREDQIIRDGYQDGLSDTQIAESIHGWTKSAVRHRRLVLGLHTRSLSIGVTAKPFDVPALPDERPSADELLERRKKQFARKEAAKQARGLIPVNVHLDGPIGIAHFGDPHVDDDGTDVGMLERHVSVINETDGLFAGNVGDFQNNWVGRLARLYAEQSTSAQDAWVLVEWLLRACDWMYLVGGNHDAWSGTGDPLQWISGQQGALFEQHGARLELRLPGGRNCRINARHDFKGHSQWNTAHGPAKAVQLGWRDHIMVCGHTHVSGYQILKDPASGLVSHAIRVASYKIFDRYADEKGLPDQNIFNCPVTIIDPRYAEDDVRFVTFVPDLEEGADFLTWKRSRKAA